MQRTETLPSVGRIWHAPFRRALEEWKAQGENRHGGARGNDIGSFREGVLVLQGLWVISEGVN